MNTPSWSGYTKYIGPTGSAGGTGFTGSSGATGSAGATGASLSNWSPFIATSDVNLCNHNISNIAGIITSTDLTLTAPVISNLATARSTNIVDNGTDVFNNAIYDIIAQNGYAGQINLTANGGYSNGINGEVIITATGSTIGNYSQGGLITLTATTPASLNYTNTSAIRLSAFGITSQAGLTTPFASITGYNVVSALNSVQLISGFRSSLPSIPGANYLYGEALLGGGGTRVENGLATDVLIPLSPNNLIIKGIGSNTVSLSNITAIACSNGAITGVSTINGSNYPPVGTSTWVGTATSDLNMAVYRISNVGGQTFAYGGSFFCGLNGNAGVLNLTYPSAATGHTADGALLLLGGTVGGTEAQRSFGIDNTNITIYVPPTGVGKLLLNANILMGGYLNLNGKPLLGLVDIESPAQSNLIIQANSSDLVLNATGGAISIHTPNMTFNTGRITELSNITNYTCPLTIATSSNSNITIGAGGTLFLLSPINTQSNSITSTSGSLLGFSTISNASGGNIYGYSITGTGSSTLSGYSVVSNTSGILVESSASNYINVSPTGVEMVAGSNSIVVPSGSSIIATGGTIVDTGGRRFHTFTGNGTFTITANPNAVPIEVFGIAGGGGGGSVSGGGGGAGNLIITSNAGGVGSNSITIGAGGAGGYYGGNTPAGSGGNTSVSGIFSAVGGGGGGTYNVGAGQNGGCGGGGSELAYRAKGNAGLGTVSSGTTISNLAFAGGEGVNNGSAGGGGGGGCSAVGQNCPSNSATGGNGGAGITYYGSQYGGGGGASPGGSYWGTPTAGTASYGGGAGSTTGNGNNGTQNTGGGGGADIGSSATTMGGNGGSGIVIISYSIVSHTVITNSVGIDLNGIVATNGNLNVGSNLTVASTLFASQIGCNVNMLSNAISNCSSLAVIPDQNVFAPLTFPFYRYGHIANLNYSNFTASNVSGTVANWYFNIVASGNGSVPTEYGIYDIYIKADLPTYRADGCNTPYPVLSANTRYSVKVSTTSNYSNVFTSWSGAIGNINDVAGLQQSGSNQYFNINVSTAECILQANSNLYFQICFENVDGSNFPGSGLFTYFARRMR